jgi:hypothetical protein
MKYLLLPLAIVAGQALACPGEGAKDAMAPADSSLAAKTSSSLKAALASRPVATPAAKDAKAQRAPQERVASKTLPEQGKAKAL